MADPPKYGISRATYLSSFELLSQDLKRIFQFIEPVDGHLGVYSHRIYELQLRSCTEFESICKEVLIKIEGVERTSYNILDYRKIENEIHVNNYEVGIPFWLPGTKYIKPFADWLTANPPLSWYRAYNNVKHNRTSRFSEASLNNLIFSIAGLFAIMVCLNIIPTDGENQIPFDGINGREFRYKRQLFTLR